MFSVSLGVGSKSAGCGRSIVGLQAACGLGGGGGEVLGIASPGITSPAAAMLYYSLDPQFSALIFSLYGRHERFTLIPDALACYAHGAPQTSDILAYAHTFGLQLYALGDHYACLLTQVRAGSVIFLVGVGSLVCWKLWEHWRKGGSSAATPTPTSTPPSRRPRGILASLLEEDLVQDLDDIEDEDPAFIHILDQGRRYLLRLVVGRYFGPDSPCSEAPCEDVSLVSSIDVSEASNSEFHARDYLADASNSYSAGDAVSCPALPLGSSSENNSLPTDEDSDAELFGSSNRIVKRKHKASEIHRNQVQGTPSKQSAANSPAIQMTSSHSNGGRKIRNDNRCGQAYSSSAPTTSHPLQDGWLSSESSPVHRSSCPPCPAPWRDLTRPQGDGSETPDSEDLAEKKKRLQRISPPRHSAGVEQEESWYTDNRLQPEGEERHNAAVSSTSLSDLMERMRQRHRGSISRDNSIASNMSDVLLSPGGSRRFAFKREDSVCSNISDFAPSECSEMSLDVSLKEDFGCKTFSCLNDIEHELDDLKSSMLEMDEEVTKFTSKPNPYMLKTTFSDYSVTSGDSRPGSALDIINNHRSRATMKGLIGTKVGTSSESEVIEGAVVNPSQSSSQVVSGSEAEGSFEWDSPQHGWSSMKCPPLSKLPEQPSEDAESSRASVQDDMMPSLEWDNDCLHQYAEEDTAATRDDPNDDVFHPNSHDRQQLLPDHSSLELDLEEELLCQTGSITENTDLRTAPMTISVDSAIHSATGSRSTSSSPLPSGLNQSFLSSSGLASSCEISPTTPDSESAGWSSWDRRLGPGEFGSKVRRYWSSEESGYMEGLDTSLDTSVLAHLSPVHEIKEKETSESSTSTPQRRIDNQNITLTEDNIKESSDNNLNNNLIMGNKSSIVNDNDLSNNTAALTTKTVMAIGQKIKIIEYAETEWHGNTPKAQIIRQGYSAIPVELNLKHLRRVRGDNYCGIRAALYQMLSLGLPLPNGHATHTRLATELKQGSTWLQDWTFGHRLHFSKEQILNGFWECLDSLDNLVLNLMGVENRECVVLSRLNGDPTLDIKLCEAVKLHMLAAALDLHIGNNNGDNVPLFAMIMFARHSSLTPRDLLKNHLNPVGDSAGLEQIEMFLMGHTLGVTLQVVRPASYGKDDFICYYPDANIGVWPEVTLVAEDDRHYNVLVK
ncbi:uncharacterized protein [Macrobrachium rosenbergii]|uniref:uncharacterized protein isoform X6 n=1 Tax=Macrobrachium rosenbergii TaxID=79674 RepID=UPI0034D3FBF3